jgi:hypothetical protein
LRFCRYLKELGVTASIVRLDFEDKEHKKPAFLDVSCPRTVLLPGCMVKRTLTSRLGCVAGESLWSGASSAGRGLEPGKSLRSSYRQSCRLLEAHRLSVPSRQLHHACDAAEYRPSQFESGAILLYLAEKYGGATTPHKRARMAAWTHFANATVTAIALNEDFRKRHGAEVGTVARCY